MLIYPLVLLNFSECPIFLMDETTVHVIPASTVPWRHHLRLAALGKNPGRMNYKDTEP